MVETIKLKDKYWVGTYRHAMPYPKNNVYNAVRKSMRISQAHAAKLLGISTPAWRYRERTKRLYHVAELLCLQELSGMTNGAFIQLLKDCA
jgi:hypothetical protein